MSVKTPVVARRVMTAIGKGGAGTLHVRGGGSCHSCLGGHSGVETKRQVQRKREIDEAVKNDYA